MAQKSYTWVVFTSKNGVDAFFSNIQCFYPKFFEYQNCKIAAVGSSTAKELENHGYKPDIINPGNTGKDLSEYLVQEVLQANDSILFPSGNLAPDTLEAAISKVCAFTRLDVYETRYPSRVENEIKQMVENDEPDMVIFTSPSGFLGYLHFFGKGKKLNFAAIGSKTAQEIQKNGFDVSCIASKPGMKEMADAISEFFAK
jgi:uroporphyrinogen-III synthase